MPDSPERRAYERLAAYLNGRVFANGYAEDEGSSPSGVGRSSNWNA